MKHLPAIIFKVIPHTHMRYETCGDYYPNKSGWQFRVSSTNAKYEFLILIHELVEWFGCMIDGIKEKDITAFDKKFEAERAEGKWTNEEPGNDPRAPYQKWHKFATGVEMLCASALEVDWREYEQKIDNL